MQIVVVNAAEVRAKLSALPGRLRQGIQGAGPPAAAIQAQAIRAATPRLTGTLAGSIQTSVTNSADGVQGKVFSDERYAPFVEGGTQKHGEGRHMFKRGSEDARRRVEGEFAQAVDRVADSF